MKRFWVSWKSGYYIDEGCTEPSIQLWNSGSIDRHDGSGRNDLTLYAVVDDIDEETIEQKLRVYFPDLEMRFCSEKQSDFTPGDRFPDFENRTIL